MGYSGLPSVNGAVCATAWAAFFFARLVLCGRHPVACRNGPVHVRRLSRLLRRVCSPVWMDYSRLPPGNSPALARFSSSGKAVAKWQRAQFTSGIG